MRLKLVKVMTLSLLILCPLKSNADPFVSGVLHLIAQIEGYQMQMENIQSTISRLNRQIKQAVSGRSEWAHWRFRDFQSWGLHADRWGSLLVPLKQKVPYLYTFNHATGEVTRLGELEPTHLSANWQMSRYFLIHYVINRESYDSDNLEVPYQLAWAQSNPTIRKQYEMEVDSQVSTSPYHKYGKDKAIRVRVVSVSRLNDNTAAIRFEKQLRDKSANTQQIAHEEAIVKWQYQSVKATQAQLDRNPLGFTVTYYQVTSVNLSHEEGK